MTKKVRRVRRPEGGPAESNRMTASSRSRKTTVEDLRAEYGYVVQDLRRVFILAVAMFAVLIALNLFLR